MAEGLFDYRAYLAMRGIFLSSKPDSTNDWKILEPSLAITAFDRSVFELVAKNSRPRIAF